MGAHFPEQGLARRGSLPEMRAEIEVGNAARVQLWEKGRGQVHRRLAEDGKIHLLFTGKKEDQAVGLRLGG